MPLQCSKLLPAIYLRGLSSSYQKLFYGIWSYYTQCVRTVHFKSWYISNVRTCIDSWFAMKRSAPTRYLLQEALICIGVAVWSRRHWEWPTASMWHYHMTSSWLRTTLEMRANWAVCQHIPCRIWCISFFISLPLPVDAQARVSYAHLFLWFPFEEMQVDAHKFPQLTNF